MELTSPSKPLLIAMVGLPRSGKSTASRSLSKTLGAPIVNRDAIRLALHGQRYQAAAEPMVKAMSRYFITSLFLTGHDIVICDETNYSWKARDLLQDERWVTKFYHVKTKIDICKQRAYETGQPDLIPVIDAMAARWEPFRDHELQYDTGKSWI